MKAKVWCIMITDKIRIKSGSLDVEKRLISCRVGLFEKIAFALPSGVEGIPFKKNRLAFLCDVKHLVCVCFGGVDVDCKALTEISSKLETYSRNKLWKMMGAKGMDLVEMLITMGAGYGFLRLVEFFIATLG